MSSNSSTYLLDAPAFQQAMSHGTMIAYRTVWLVLQIIGTHVMLPILIVTFLASRVVRHPLMINMCITWVITGIVSSLLLYANQYGTDGPTTELCIAQASLIFATPPMASSALACLMYNVWFSTNLSANKIAAAKTSLFRQSILLAIPYLVFVAYAIPGTVIAFSQTAGVTLTRHHFYCSVAHGPYSITTACSTAVFLIVSLYWEFRIIAMILKLWVRLRNMRLGAGCQLWYLLRVVALGLYVLVGFTFCMVTVFVPSIAPDMILATIPIFCGLLFSTSRDVWQTWLRRTPRLPPIVPELSGPSDRQDFGLPKSMPV